MGKVYMLLAAVSEEREPSSFRGGQFAINLGFVALPAVRRAKLLQAASVADEAKPGSPAFGAVFHDALLRR
jgi:hypothetical protein